MTFDADFSRLDRTARILRWVRWIGGALALVTLATAATAWPGPWGRGLAFNDVQIHLDLMNYFGKIGVETTNYDDQLILGFRFEQIHALIRVISIVPAILAIAGLLQQRWRRALAYGALWYVMTSIPNVMEEKHGYEVAIPAEFGVRPAEVLFALPQVNTSFANAQQRLRAENTGKAQIQAYYAHQPEARLTRAQTIRRELDGAMNDLTPPQAAAMQYTAAQVAYLEQDIAPTRRHLNLISPAAFHPTWDSDYRLRRMREWVEARGGGLSQSAYAPITGWPLSFVRFMSKLCAALGLIMLVTYGVSARASLILAKRLGRMRRLEELLREVAPLARTEAASAGFGKRSTNFAQPLETKYSG